MTLPARQDRSAVVLHRRRTGGKRVRQERQVLATALADVFLAGLWSGPGLRMGAAMVLGARHGWARRLSTAVLLAYPHAPLDRPRELAAFVSTSAALDEVERRTRGRRRPFPQPQHRITISTTMVRHPFPVTRVDDAGALAGLLGLSMPELLWFADPKGLQRRAGREQLQHYRSRWITAASGAARLLEAPKFRLREVQRTVLRQLLGPVPVHSAAHGFVAGRSVRTGAVPHVGAAVVISLDLESFFASITAGRIYGVLRSTGYPEPVAHLLTGLCTQSAPVSVLAAMPDLADPPSAFRLRRRLAEPHLPQGAPTSPQLANLCAFHLDDRLSGYAAAAGLVYTRYADDLTFSGGDPSAGGPVIAAVRTMVADEGFALNPSKTRIRRQSRRQQVTGVVVNTRPRVPREEYDTLRAILHNCGRTGPAEQNRDGVADFRAHLRGRIAWVASLDGEHGRRLLAAFARIDWR